jgi:NAD+ synthase
MEAAGKEEHSPLDLNMEVVHDLLVRFIRDEVHAAGFSKGVVGVSGGVDSAVSAALAADALGKRHVRGVVMPHATSSPQSIEDAELVIEKLAIRSEYVDITEMVDAYCGTNGAIGRIRRGNVMARARMIVLYDISARDAALVIGTSNKTELMVGYGTLYGDTACALNPIGDLYKTQIWQLARHLGLPKRIVGKQPTADLWEGQTDEGEMGMKYAELDRLLFHLVDERRGDDELRELGFDTKFIRRVRELIQKNQFKRRPPVIAKVSYRTVNVDFRYARDWGV